MDGGQVAGADARLEYDQAPILQLQPVHAADPGRAKEKAADT
jgi:hypothetical protein